MNTCDECGRITSDLSNQGAEGMLCTSCVENIGYAEHGTIFVEGKNVKLLACKICRATVLPDDRHDHVMWHQSLPVVPADLVEQVTLSVLQAMDGAVLRKVKKKEGERPRYVVKGTREPSRSRSEMSSWEKSLDNILKHTSLWMTESHDQ